METKDIISLTLGTIGSLTGIAGLVLGIVNTWKAHSKDKVKLRLELGWTIRSNDPNKYFSIRVTNMSSFPVTIKDVGVHCIATKQRIIDTLLNVQGFLPNRLEPRTSVSFHHQPEFHVSKEFLTGDYVYATTDCGTTVRDFKRFKGYQKEALQQ